MVGGAARDDATALAHLPRPPSAFGLGLGGRRSGGRPKWAGLLLLHLCRGMEEVCRMDRLASSHLEVQTLLASEYGATT